MDKQATSPLGEILLERCEISLTGMKISPYTMEHYCETVTTFVLTFARRLNKQITTTCGELTISHHLKAFNLKSHILCTILNSGKMLSVHSVSVGNEDSSKPHQIHYHYIILQLNIYILLTRNTCLQQPLAFISKHCFNTMFQHEVFRIISTLTQAGFACVM